MHALVTNSEIDVAEPLPRLSRFGVGGGLIVAVMALAISAPGIRPTVFPHDPEVLVSFAVWWVSAALALWLAVSLAVWMVVLGRPTPPPAAWVRRITVPGSRQLAEAMLAVSVIAIPAACTAGATQVAPPRIEVLSSGVDGQLGEVLASSTVPPVVSGQESSDDASGFAAGVGTLTDAPPATLLADSSAPLPGSLDVEAGSSLAPGLVGGLDDSLQNGSGSDVEPSVPMPADAVHVVVKGDNFWIIAESQLAAVTGGSPTNFQIASYWRQLVDANHSSIASGNPDLIYPGEQLVLPAVFTE